MEVQLPRFLLERSYSLRDALQTLNITRVFQDDADITNMGEAKGPKLSQVSEEDQTFGISDADFRSHQTNHIWSVCLALMELRQRVQRRIGISDYVMLCDLIFRIFPQVYHKSVISVDESGDDTVVGGGVTTFATPPPRLTFNRPFIFIIYQESTGSLLFIGRVSDPTQK